MFFIDTNTKCDRPLSLSITCPDAGISFWGMTKETSSHDLCLEVPTTRIKVSLLSFLNKDVLIRSENVTLNGTIGWYTIDGDYYYINICINKPCRCGWKELLAETVRLSLRTEVRQAAP